VENLREVGARYRRSMSAQIGLLTGEVNSLRATVTEIGETVAQQKSEIELEAGRLGEALTTNSAAFEQTQAERQENFTSQLSAFAQLAGALEEASQSAANALADLSEKSDAAIAEIEAIKERAEAASNYLGINALAAGYHDTADTEERRAFWLRLGAIGCFLAQSAHRATTSFTPSLWTGS
jgi:chromosome segregation ATPase